MPVLHRIWPNHALIIFTTAAVFTFFHLLCDIEWRWSGEREPLNETIFLSLKQCSFFLCAEQRCQRTESLHHSGFIWSVLLKKEKTTVSLQLVLCCLHSLLSSESLKRKHKLTNHSYINPIAWSGTISPRSLKVFALNLLVDLDFLWGICITEIWIFVVMCKSLPDSSL